MGILTKKKKEDDKKEEQKKTRCHGGLADNLEEIRKQLEDCDDVVYKEFRVGKDQLLEFALVFTDGMVDKNFINQAILDSLMVHAREVPPEAPKVIDKVFQLVRYGTIPAMEIKEGEYIEDAISGILTGDAILFINSSEKFLILGAKGWPTRSVSEPNTEALVRGPRDGFTETFRVNTALVRRRIRDPRLKIKQLQVGTRSKTDCGILYIDDIVMDDLVMEVYRRLKTIDIDAVLESGYVEQLIEDNYLSLFPQVRATERPDEVAGALLEGRVAILVDNSPFALIVPTTLNSLFQSPEDYYDRWFISSILRFVRYVASILSLILPALYVAVTSYHPGILPMKLVLSIAATRQGIPFPALLEAILMEATFELLREAGIRLPQPIGSTIGIVGGIVIGSAAVEAGIVSPIMVIIVAITAIASFSIPNYALSVGLRMLRFGLIVLSGVLGLYGVMLGLLLILGHMTRLKSFGVPYMSPFVSFNLSDHKDTIPRVPIFMMRTRPFGLAKNKHRMKNNRHLINQVEDGGDKNAKK